MQIIITGGAGFLGQLLAKEILKSDFDFEELHLVDIVLPINPMEDIRVKCTQTDLSEKGIAEKIVTDKTAMVFHLAAIVSSHAEKEFDLGWQVNVDSTRMLLEACRNAKNDIKFIFASSLAVYGGDIPEMIESLTAIMPQSSYGAQKAICELMVNDYSRKGFIDGRILRLPTVCVRPRKANLAASSFVSGIMREPLNGEIAVCPVSAEIAVWISSPETIIQNFIHAANLNKNEFGSWLPVNLPGLQVTVNQMIATLKELAGNEVANKIIFEKNEDINKIVVTWPTKVDNTIALNMGFWVDASFEAILKQHMKNYL